MIKVYRYRDLMILLMLYNYKLRVKVNYVVAKLHKNISGVNQTTLSIVNGMKAHYNHEIKEISTLVTDLSSKVNTFNNDQVL